MTFPKEQQKLFLVVAIAVIVLVNGYRLLTAAGPQTAPLTYARGAVASTPVRPAAQGQGAADPVRIFLERSAEPYPGVVRDVFRMENPVVRLRSKPAQTVVVTAPLPPPAPERTSEEIAADLARSDLAKFRYLGYVTDKDSTIFLSKEGELFIVKGGDNVQGSYKVKEANKDFMVIWDTTTRVERRIEMSGGAQQPQSPPTLPTPPSRPLPPAAQPFQPRPQQFEPPPRPQQAEQPDSDRMQKRRQRSFRAEPE